ncbi:PKD domain-containing protein [Salibacter halophilus]|uniref:PKD domain-containing protein n=1 Tax=Salibacter halophilus TaxID=1803916 RepID=A0A6N6M8Y0_9FLAO|nr:PKD domain-containing protein [Salibacter halophilus]KAB1065516.1 PKD domain-containing protein [Salibacter halophilus]
MNKFYPVIIFCFFLCSAFSQNAVAQVDVVNKGVSITNTGSRIYIDGNLYNRLDSLSQSTDGSIANGDSIFITGNIYNQATNSLFTTNSGVVVFNGANSQSVFGDSLVDFYTLTLDKASGELVLQKDLSVLNELKFTQGNIVINDKNILLGNSGSLVGEDNNNRVYNGNGYIIANRFLDGSLQNQNLAGIGVSLDYSLNPGQTTIKRGHGVQQNVTNGSIERYFELSTNSTYQIDSFRIDYLTPELAGNNASNLSMWQSNTGGNSWNSIEGVLNTGNQFATGQSSTINQSIITLSETDCDSTPQPNLPDTAYLCGNDSFLLNPQVPGLLYNWSTGDSTHTIFAAQAGTYFVTVTTLSGCRAVDTTEVIQKPKPVTAFSTNNICLGDTAFFTNNTSITSTQITNWKWTFDVNGTLPDSALTENTSFNYQNPGAYQVELVATSEFGCTDTAQNQVIVFSNPQAGFTVADNCADSTVNFTNTSSIQSGGMLYQWDFGDASTSTSTSPSHTYTSSNPYQVELIATSNAGCEDTAQQTIQIFSNPTADFTLQNVCVGQDIGINNLSTYSGQLSYSWNFSDNTSDTAQTPQKFFNTGGIYTVTLTATTNNGCADTAIRSVNVTSGPFASFTASNVCDGEAVTLSNNTQIYGNTTYSWDFGNSQSSTDSVPQLTYASPGVYNISLIASSTNGCSDTATQQVTVNPNPVSSFSVSNPCVNSALSIQNNTTVSTGSLTYAWDFNDGTTDTAQTPTKQYNLPTNYTIELVATSGAGCTDTSSQQINVQPLPVVSIEDTAVCGTSYVLDAENPGATYNWSSGATSRRDTVDTSGNYYVTVTDQNSCSTVDTANIFLNPTPVPDLGPDTTVCGSYNLQTGLPQNHLWSNNSTASNITVTTSGVYAVEVTNSLGCSGSDTVQVTIQNDPQVNLGNDFIQCAGDSVTLDAGVGNYSYSWNTGDITQELTVDTTGGYAVTVTTSAGCVSSDSVHATFRANPVADFTFADVCEGNQASFTNTSSQPNGGSLSYSWDFDNGSTSTASQTSQTFQTAGSYNIQLVAENTTGCKDTTTKQLTVNPNPSALFTTQNVCLGDSAVFNNNSTVSGTTLSYNWSFDDGQISTLNNPGHLYASAGVYTVELSAQTPFGCSDSTTQNIQVYNLPVSTLSDSIIECGNSTTIQAGNGSQLYSWSNGESTSNATIDTTGTYTVTITNTNGCSVEDSVYVKLFNPLVFNLNNTVISCDSVTLDPGVGGLAYNWNTGDTTQALTVNNSGSYTLQAIDSNGCSFTDTAQVTINQSPVVNLGSNDTLCTGNSKTLNAGNSSASHIWSTGSPNQAITVSNTGTYSVTTTSQAGCSTVDSVDILFNQSPSANFNFTNTCQGDTVAFTDQSTNVVAGSTHNWQFGDGNTATGQNQNHHYTSNGNYTATLAVTTPDGCSSTKTKQVVISPLPVASFTANDVCVGSAVNFFNTSSVSTGSLSYQWDFGDGNTSSAANPSHNYATDGQYVVSLIATSSAGCNSTFTDTVEVFTQPQLNLGGNISTCADSTTLSATNPGSSYLWSNNTTDSVLTVTQNGNYAVTVTSQDGCTNSDQVNVQLSTPVSVDLGADTLVCDSILLDAGNPGATFSWSNAATSQALTVTNTGIYEVTITDQNGCVGSDTIQVTVQNGPVVNLGNDTVFCSSQSPITLDAGAGYANYNWNNGATNPTIVVDSTSIYEVTVSAGNGCTQTDQVAVSVHETPDAAFAVSNVCESQSASFVNQTVSQTAVSYAWDFDNGNSSNGQSPTEQYTAGSYNPQLIAATAQGCADTVSALLTVNPNPVAGFTATTGCEDQAVSFTDGTSISSGSYSINWDFGNGDTAISSNPQVTYNSAGFYPVTLATVSDSGCVDTAIQVLDINETPQASLADSVELCANSYSLDAQNTGSSYNWNNSASTQSINVSTNGLYIVTITNPDGCSVVDSSFVELNTPVSASISGLTVACDSTTLDAGNTGASFSWSTGDTNQNITVSNSGNYAVTVTNTQGCFDTASATVTINNSPSVDIGPDTTICPSAIIALDAGNPGATYNWNGSGTGQITIPTNQGTYSVTVTDQNGCSTVDSMQLSHFDAPNSAFTTNNVCVSDSIEFINNSTIANGSLTYNWQFGDGQADTATSPSHLYASAGTYNVVLTATSNNGCVDVSTSTIQVRPQPTASFNASASCADDMVNFVNTSSISNGSLNYNWDFDDGNTSTNTNPQKSYSTAATYNVELVATSGFGCVDTVQNPLVINPLPVLTMPDSIQTCSNDTTLDAGNSGSSFIWSNVTFNQTLNVQNTGNYAVTVTTPQGCSADTSVYVSFNNLFNPDLAQQTSGCDSVTVNAGNLGSSYLWNTGDTTRLFTTDSTDSYSVEITDGNGCITFDTVAIMVNESPQVNLGPDTAFCEGGSVILDAGYPGSSFTWSNNANGQSQTVSTTGNYFVTVVDTNNCFGTDNRDVTVYPEPEFELGNDTLICDSMELTITSSFDAYSWNTGDTTSSIMVSDSGLYVAQATSTQGCVFSDSILIDVQPGIPFDLGEDTTLCAGSSLTLDPGVVGDSYQWSFGGSNSVLTVGDSGTYWLNLTSANGCVTTDTITIDYYNNPQPDLGGDLMLCTGQQVTLSTGSNPTSNFTWYLDSTDLTDTVAVDSSSFELSNDSASITASDSGLYWVEVSDSNGCFATDTAHISISDNFIEARFLSASEAVVGDTIKFISISFPDSLPHYWNFDDGVTSQEFDPAHPFFMSDTFMVSLVVSNGFCSDSTAKPIYIGSGKKPGEVESDTIPARYTDFVSAKFWPNPVRDFGTLQYELRERAVVQVDLFDLNGALLRSYTETKQFSERQFNTQKLAPGMYIIRLMTGNKQLTLKFIKN